MSSTTVAGNQSEIICNFNCMHDNITTAALPSFSPMLHSSWVSCVQVDHHLQSAHTQNVQVESLTHYYCCNCYHHYYFQFCLTDLFILDHSQTHCNNPITSSDPFWAHCAYGRWCRCEEDPVNSLSGGLEETTRMPPHHVAEHHTARSEIPQSHTAWSNGYGPEPVSVEDMVDIQCYAILTCMPETTMTTPG